MTETEPGSQPLRVVWLEAGEPITTTVSKFNALCRLPNCDPHLVYWERTGDKLSYPLASELPRERLHKLAGNSSGGFCGQLTARIRIWFRMGRILQELRPFVVQSSAVDFLLVAMLTVDAPGGFVFCLQDTRDWMRWWWSRPLMRSILKRTCMVTVTSPRFESQFLRRYRLISNDHAVMCLPNTVSSSLFSAYRRREVTSELVIGYIGTFRGADAIRALVGGIAEARQAGVTVSGLFAGTGKELPLVRELCAAVDHLVYWGPFDQSRDLRRLYEKVDVIYAIYDDTEDKHIHWACRLGEAVFARLPIIVMSGTFMAEMVAEYGIGFDAPLGDAGAIRDVIIKLSGNKALSDMIARRCAQVSDRFSFATYEPIYLATYGDLLRAAARRDDDSNILSRSAVMRSQKPRRAGALEINITHRFDGIVHLQSGNTLYASLGHRVFKSVDEGNNWSHLRDLRVFGFSRLKAGTRLSRRMLRAGIQHITEIDGRLTIIAHPLIYTCEPHRDKPCSPPATVVGSRPLVLCNAGKCLYYGEYRGYRIPRPIHVFASEDAGQSWHVVYTFSGVGHVHGVFHDPYEGGLWITTGDSDAESGIWLTMDRFRTVETVFAGSQSARAIRLIFTEDHIYFGTDTPQQANYICRLERKTGRVAKLVEVPGSVFHGCQTARGLFFSTACEPNEVQRYRFASVWGSRDGENWSQIAQFRKDMWHRKLFQYGQIIFAEGQEQSTRLWMTPFATEGDQVSLCVDPWGGADSREV
jgi:glycosyltransferase involved in cell wall biosynthesis